MTDMLRGLGGWWFWLPAITGAVLWTLVGVAAWRYGTLAALLVGLAGLGFLVLCAGLGLVGLFVCDAHEPICAYAGCRRRAPLQLRGAPYQRPFCPQHARERPIPPPQPIETYTLDDLPGVVDASGTRSGPR